MNPHYALSRRRLLRLAFTAGFAPVAAGSARLAFAADAPLLAVGAPEAQAVKYVEGARQASGATAGSNCANCGMYQGAAGFAQGAGPPFPRRAGKAARGGYGRGPPLWRGLRRRLCSGVGP